MIPTCVCYTCYNMQTVSQLSKQRQIKQSVFVCTGFYLFYLSIHGSGFTADSVTSSLSPYFRHSCCETAVSLLPTVEAYDIAQCLVWRRREWCVCVCHTHTITPLSDMYENTQHFTSRSANVKCSVNCVTATFRHEKLLWYLHA